MTNKINNLDFLQTCHKYGVRTDEKIDHLIKGQKAENEVYNILSHHLNNSEIEYKILTDVNLHNFHKTQIDIILILNGFVWIIEVKNYNGLLKLSNQKLQLNNFKFERNEIEYCNTRTQVVKNTLKDELEKMPKIKTSMFLMNENSEFETDSEVPIEVISRNMVNRIVKETIHTAHSNNFSPSIVEITNAIKKNSLESFFMPTPLSEGEIQHIHCGA